MMKKVTVKAWAVVEKKTGNILKDFITYTLEIYSSKCMTKRMCEYRNNTAGAEIYKIEPITCTIPGRKK